MERPWFNFYEQNIPRSPEIPGKTMAGIFEETCKKFPQRPAVTYFGRHLSYMQLGREVRQFSVALHRLGVKHGTRVAIMLPNIPQYAIVHFAALRLGAILVPTNPLYVERELAYQLNDSGAEIIIALDFFFPRIQAVVEQTSLQHIILTRANEFLPPVLKLLYPIQAVRNNTWIQVRRAPGIHFYDDLRTESFKTRLPENLPHSEDTAMFLYTGGTTGLSKGAILTHRNLVANVIQIRTWYDEVNVGRESVLCALPFFHSYGLTTCLHLGILLASKLVMIPNPRDIKTMLRQIEKERASLFSGVPTLFVAINNYPEISRFDLSSVKCCVSGGAPLPLEVARRFEAVSGGRLVEGYGLSETSPVTHANPIRGKRKEGSIGLPLPGTDARVVDPETRQTLPPGQVGELAVKGPQVMKGYWNMKEETEAALKEGWFFTGDIARMDADGYFYIVDRQKDVIIAGGFNIYPREIEDVLFEHPKVLEAAVVGVADAYRGESVKAFVVLKQGVSAGEKEIIEFCRQNLASFKVPRYIELRDSLPKSNIGKVLRRALRNEPDRKRTV